MAIVGQVARILGGDARSVVRVGRRHPDVDHGKVRHRVRDDGPQRLGVPGHPHDRMAGVGEQSRQALPEERAILRDHDAHGSTASITVPWPRGLRIESDPPRAATRSASPASPVPAAITAPPRPSSAIRTSTRASERTTRTSMRSASACFTALVSASLAT